MKVGFTVEGIQILPARRLAGQRSQGKVRTQAVQDADDLLLLLCYGQQLGDLICPILEPVLL